MNPQSSSSADKTNDEFKKIYKILCNEGFDGDKVYRALSLTNDYKLAKEILQQFKWYDFFLIWLI